VCWKSIRRRASGQWEIAILKKKIDMEGLQTVNGSFVIPTISAAVLFRV